MPENLEDVRQNIKKEADKLARIELAELAQDKEIKNIVGDYSDPTQMIDFTEEELKKQDYLYSEIQFSLKSEVIKKNPQLIIQELEDIPEPRDEEVIESNSGVIRDLFAKLESSEEKLGKQKELDLSQTFMYVQFLVFRIILNFQRSEETST